MRRIADSDALERDPSLNFEFQLIYPSPALSDIRLLGTIHIMQAYEKDDGLFHTEAFHAEQAARATKAERCKKVGEPIECPSKIISFEINGQDAWTAESGWVARKVDLRVSSRLSGCTMRDSADPLHWLAQTGKAKMVLRGHEGPVTCLATFEDTVNARTIVFTGSWDKTIKTWDGQVSKA